MSAITEPSTNSDEVTVGPRQKTESLLLTSSGTLDSSTATCELEQLNLSNVSSAGSFCDYHLTLPNLPAEILHQIAMYLDARTVLLTLCLVCKDLQRVFSSDATWKARILKRWPFRYPTIKIEEEIFNWKKAAVEREDHYNLWKGLHDRKMKEYNLTGHISDINVVHLMKNADLCVSGSRDRSIKVWDLRKLEDSQEPKTWEWPCTLTLDLHHGWVWSITSLDNIVCTSSWDCTVKLWDMNQNGHLLYSLKDGSAQLCTVYHHDILLVGTYNKKIMAYDPRASCSLISSRESHSKPVLCLVADDKYIISGSEDGKLVIYDRRADKDLKTRKMKYYPMSLSYGDGQLWIGDKKGNIHLADAQSGLFNDWVKFDSVHERGITGMHHSWGSLITASIDRTIKVHHPTNNPVTITSLQNHLGAVSSISVQNNVLASSSSDQTVRIWRPTTETTETQDTLLAQPVTAHLQPETDAIQPECSLSPGPSNSTD